VVDVRDDAEISDSLDRDFSRRFLFFSVHSALW
jgi:hypothetical protein